MSVAGPAPDRGPGRHGVRAGVVVTGTEVLTGRVGDRNGPWLAERLRLLGVDVGQVVVVGDRRDDLASALRFLATGNDLLVTSGGLGPTADDLTAEVVAEVQGRPMRLDPDVEARIAGIVRRLSARAGTARDPRATAAGVRKQAMVPDGALVLDPAGTAPGLVVPVAAGRAGPPVVVLPGPPWELQQMWPLAAGTPAVREILAGAPPLRQDTLRLWGVPESELAATLRRLDGALTGLEITTCLRSGELEVVSRYGPAAAQAQERLVAAVRTDFPAALFSTGPTVDELVADALAARSYRIAAVDAATAGALAARLAAMPTAVFAGCLTLPPGAPVPGGGAGDAEVLVALGPGAPGEELVRVTVQTPVGDATDDVPVNGPPERSGPRVASTALHAVLAALTGEGGNEHA